VFESTTLTVDANESRTRRTAPIFEFMDLTPTIALCPADISLSRRHSHDGIAVVFGAIASSTAWEAFIPQLKRDPLHPPLLVLPEHHFGVFEKFGCESTSCRLLDEPARMPQVSELLRRASLRRLEDGAHANHPNDGPTGLSIAVRGIRRMIEQVAGFDTTVLVLGVSGTGSAASWRFFS
jgi:sigma-54 specific flagellar transcriptional regulator A